MKKKIFVRIAAMILALVFVTGTCLGADVPSPEQAASNILAYQKNAAGLTADDSLFDAADIIGVGSSVGDWYAFSMGRLGVEDNYVEYLKLLEKYVSDAYTSGEKLDVSKATEWHRISLAVLSAGGDPTAFGTDKEGNTINLISEGVYNWAQTESLGSQGTNAWIYALIALDSMGYKVPEGAGYTRTEIITNLLSRQNEDGGFALSASSDTSDPDMTAMAVQALSTYYNSTTVFEYKSESTGETVSKKVSQVIDEAVGFIASQQSEDGKFVAWGEDSCETAAQVVMALCSVGIDPREDERFIKDGMSLYDVLMSYSMSDGGFKHTSGDQDSNAIACEQALTAIAALTRFDGGYRKLFDLREEQPEELRNEIKSLREDIAALADDAGEDEVNALYERYSAIPDSEKEYVYNYSALYALMESFGIEDETPGLETAMELCESGVGVRIAVIELPAPAVRTDNEGNSADADNSQSAEPENNKDGSGGNIIIMAIAAVVAAAAIVFIIVLVGKKKNVDSEGK